MEQPNAQEAEQAVIGSVLKASTVAPALIAILPAPSEFYNAKRQKIWSTVLTLHACGQPPDLMTVTAELEMRGQLDEVGGRVALVDMVELVASTGRATFAAEIVAEKARKRRLLVLFNEGQSAALDNDRDAGDVAADIGSRLVSACAEGSRRGSFRPLSRFMPEILEELDQVWQGKTILGVKTHFQRLDDLTGGFQTDGLIIIAGRPRMGKTSFMNAIAVNLAKNGKRVAFASAETKGKEFGLRVLCSEAKQDSLRVRSGKLSEAEWNALTESAGKIAQYPYWVDDTPEIEVNTLINRVSDLKQNEDVDILFVDYLQQLTTAQKFDQRRLAVDYQISQLKLCAKTLDIPVVLGCQINRSVETRGGNSWRQKRPTLGDLKESGRIEEVADLIIGLFRPEIYIGDKKAEKAQKHNITEAIILKQRNGPVDTIDMYFNPVFTSYEDIVPELPEGAAPF